MKLPWSKKSTDDEQLSSLSEDQFMGDEAAMAETQNYAKNAMAEQKVMLLKKQIDAISPVASGIQTRIAAAEAKIAGFEKQGMDVSPTTKAVPVIQQRAMIEPHWDWQVSP